jgi:glucose-6-phosphate 1-dehydrogenase
MGFCRETRPESCGFILFGATGDLAARKIIPALFGLISKKLMPKEFYLLFVGRTPLEPEAFKARISAALRDAGFKPLPGELDGLLARAEYLRADYDSDGFYLRLQNRLTELDQKYHISRKRLFYLATPPAAFEPITEKLKASRLLYDAADTAAWSRLIIEKPYGSSLESACRLDTSLKENAAESQIYRIDHFTGKETVQNILALRATNSVFDETWNNRFIDHVQITVFEQLGLEGRTAFFERMGLARDMMSHIFQLAAVTAMDLPPSFRDTDFKLEKQKFFASIPLFKAEEAGKASVRGQYTASAKFPKSYRDETGAAPESQTETFLAFRFFVENERWRGVPFYVRAGKKMNRKKTKIAVVYKKPAHGMFARSGDDFSNIFTMNIQPEETMLFDLNTKHPGPRLCFTSRTMKLNYREHGGETLSPTDYERLLMDAMAGDQTLFLSAFEMEFMWRFVSPMLKSWADGRDSAPLYFYPGGSTGPKAARSLIEKDGRKWL